MTKQISDHASAAKAIRAELKKHGINASVKAHTASMTSSVDVDIKQDICPATFKAIEAFAKQFQMGSFNGMEDIYEYDNKSVDFPQVKYVFVRVEFSDMIKAQVSAYIENLHIVGNQEQHKHMALNGSWGTFWEDKQPRVGA